MLLTKSKVVVYDNRNVFLILPTTFAGHDELKRKE